MGKLTLGQTGLSYQCNKVSFGGIGAPKCSRCQQRVYFNEEKKAIGKSWHKKCFSCEHCKKPLDSTNFNQANGEKIYCTSCYRKYCGPRVYGFVSGATLPTVADIEVSYKAEPKSLKSYHDSPSLQENHSQSNIFRAAKKYDHSPERRSLGQEKMKRYFSEVSVKPADRCGRCGKQVFFAEEVRMGKKKWHKNCFRCGHCGKYIEPGKCSVHEGDLFCGNCYSRFFGLHGYNNGFSSDLLSSSSSLSQGGSEATPTRDSSEVDSVEHSLSEYAYQN